MLLKSKSLLNLKGQVIVVHQSVESQHFNLHYINRIFKKETYMVAEYICVVFENVTFKYDI